MTKKTVLQNKTFFKYILMFILLLVINSSCAENIVKPDDTNIKPLPLPDITKPSTEPSDTAGSDTAGSDKIDNSNAVQLHLVIAADTSDSQIGRSVAVDSKKFQTLMEDIVNQSRGELVLKKIVLESNALNNNNLLRAIDFPKVNPDDIFIFLYAGHGHRFQSTPTRWPLMDTPGRVTDFAVVIEKIKNKNPRLFILLADCCNAVIDVPLRRFLYSARELNFDAIKQMFLISDVQIAASGSLPGQFSYGNNEQGGLFTSSFLSNLSQALLSNGAGWEDIFQKTRQDVVNMSGLSGNEQTPQYQRYK
ncbi:Caspase domain-containing protein [Desulfonema limicola]|uniref:Caspase domain-containing protein n=1 Tax=Desulfonema limicola TaxID=45656 RepID=A0A975B6M6_9BACT|nr:caspase family protein [Desulfonema limicola]QTA79771.1 Caspase domain-containing protein [Desulfonema limicola]